jgi:uncharacterized membrane protein YgdD (TMEM256/DUF423 family)
MEKRCLIWSGIHGFLAVTMGAFSAHALKQVLDPEALTWIETAARYEMYHAIALLALGALASRIQAKDSKSLLKSAWAFAWGAAIFSGSLYLMAFSNWRFLGAITPIGGLSLLYGWLNLIIFSSRYL